MEELNKFEKIIKEHVGDEDLAKEIWKDLKYEMRETTDGDLTNMILEN